MTRERSSTDADPSGPFDERSPGRSAGHGGVLLSTQSHVLRLIATGQPFESVLEALVAAVETHCPGCIGSILLMDDDGEHLRHGAAPGLPTSYNELVDGLRIGPRVGSCGTAAYRGEPVIVEDIQCDPLWEDYRDLAATHRLRACWSQPILSAGHKVLGTFAMYHARPRRPKPTERETIAVMAHLAGIAIERQRATRQRRALERRLLTQKTALVELAKSAPLDWNDFRTFARRAVEAAAATLGLARVSVWLFNEDRSVLLCEDLYELETDRHSSGLELESSGYPRYFAALERGRSVVAHDARRDPDTSEFTESYLAPLGITSMLDAPIRRAGKLVGVVCHEHVGPARIWTPDEQDFAASLGDLISLAIASSERRRAQQSFRSAQEELLRQDFQARRQIEFELDRLKDELVRQTRLATIGQVAASIAHELRNPLGAIRNAAYCLRKQDAGDQATRNEYLAIIEQEIRRSDDTINDLLAMSQAKAPIKEVVDLAKIVRDSFEYVRREGIDLETSFEPRPFLVDADPGQMRQVLTNLMSNSIDAMDPCGKIVVRVRREAAFDVVLVKDDGSGIPFEVRARIFEPLVTTKAKGTGLGLPICRQIVERHGGTIDAVDTDGNGAGFRIRLPRAAPE